MFVLKFLDKICFLEIEIIFLLGIIRLKIVILEIKIIISSKYRIVIYYYVIIFFLILFLKCFCSFIVELYLCYLLFDFIGDKYYWGMVFVVVVFGLFYLIVFLIGVIYYGW